MFLFLFKSTAKKVDWLDFGKAENPPLTLSSWMSQYRHN